ncbi:MAG: adenine deaminase [Firmicutes bacterium]|nr:adenine deaminase [Bacillota bacterium]
MSLYPIRKHLYEIGHELVATATGRTPADVIIRSGRLVNVITREILDGPDIAIRFGRIALVGDASKCRGRDTLVIDAKGSYLVPGFLDGHVHIESSMVTVGQFAKAVLPYGTTAVFMDPHEIANVLGMKGIKLMIEEGKNLPLKVYTTMPSCVPAAPGFEDTGAEITPDDISTAMAWDEVVGLGEMMNFPGVLAGDPDVHKKIASTLKAGKVVTGHYAVPDLGPNLSGYVSCGILSCHESVTCQESLAKLRLGMYAKLREGSGWKNIKETIKTYTEADADPRRIVLVTDDVHPDTLLTLGHINHVVKRVIEEGTQPITAIQMATINTAECFGMSRDLGSITPGKFADILFIEDLANPYPEKVMADGKVIAENRKMLMEIPVGTYPRYATKSMNLARSVVPDDFYISSGSPGKSVRIRVIQVIEGQAITKQVEVGVCSDKNGGINASRNQDLAKAAVIERHKGTGKIGLGFVKGFGLQSGAVASTVAHDSHNLLVMGMDDDDMAVAANTLAEVGGGMVVVKRGEVIGLLPLPVAGLMSNKPVEEVQLKVESLAQAWKDLGCTLTSPFMTMAILSLPVIPELRLTNRGLVDVEKFCFVPLVIS